MLFKPNKKSDNYRRMVDELVEESFESLPKRLGLVSKKKIRLWKSLTIIVFMLGLVSSLVWLSSTDQFSTSYMATIEESTSFMCGDVSLDNQVTAYDAGMIQQYLNNTISLNPQQKLAADTDDDKDITPVDARLILLYGLGIIPSLPFQDQQPPSIVDQSPAKGATHISPGTSISLAIVDQATGVDKNSLSLKVNGQPVELEINYISQYRYEINYIPSAAFGWGQTVNIQVEAKDQIGNSLLDNYWFKIAPASQGSVALFIDQDTYSQLIPELGRYKLDILNDLMADSFIYLKGSDWQTAQDIRQKLQFHYQHDKLLGSILIGDVPTAHLEYQNQYNGYSDWYYQDLDDTFWVDQDNDGKFERESYFLLNDITMREVWSGRIKSPVSGLEGIDLLKNFFQRNHQFRRGQLDYDQQMLFYNSLAINEAGWSQTQYSNFANSIDDYTGLYTANHQIDAVYDPDMLEQKQSYLDQLTNCHDFTFVNIHGTPTRQWVGDDVWINYNEIKDAQPNSFFNVLASCSNGGFLNSNYFAGWFLFSGQSQVVMANTVTTMLVGADDLNFLASIAQLRHGVSFGQMYKNNQSFLVEHLLGDPTLSLRPKPTGPLPELAIGSTSLDFGTISPTSQKQQTLSISNPGEQELMISHALRGFTVNQQNMTNCGTPFYYINHNGSSGFYDIILGPGESYETPFVFDPSRVGVTGNYSMTILFYTNDPDYPYLNIYLTGNAQEDSLPPYTTNHLPAPGSSNISALPDISLDLKDDEKGVDKASIVMQVNDQVVSPVISGNKNVYTLTYTPLTHFKSTEKIKVKIDAQDLANNPMSTDNYSFEIALYGDVSLNGQVSAYDAAFIQQYLVGIRNLSDKQKKVADVNLDQQITEADKDLILQYGVGLIPYLPYTGSVAENNQSESEATNLPLTLTSQRSQAYPGEDWTNAIDDDTRGWNGTVTADNRGAYAVFKLNQVSNLSKIRLMSDTQVGYSSRWVKTFSVKVSQDGESYTTVLNHVDTDTGNWKEFIFSPTQAQYVRLELHQTQGSGQDYIQLGEFEVWGN